MTTNATQSAAVHTAQDLFALTDEQILDITPESTETASVGQPFLAVQQHPSGRGAGDGTQGEAAYSRNETASPAAVSEPKPAQPEMAVPPEPPAWLAARMQDPWGGEEAREFWDGVQQARSEAAAYRAAIASPEDARALKELYPGGVSDARAAAERARLLDEVDRAYFGTAGNSPEQTSTSRAQLAQSMLREDPAAFREMVEAGIKVLQEATGAQSGATKSLASAISDEGNAARSATMSALSVGAAPQLGNVSANDAHVAAYVAFERAANEDLERSVGTAIQRTLAQALPSFEQHNTPGQGRHSGQAGAQHAAPLRERLAASVRGDVEKALQGDRQLGEQVAQILASRRFDNEARAQIVRLIGERAQQLVPSAAKRVLNEWTQTTLAAHRGRSQPGDAASARSEVAMASAPARPIRNEETPARRQDVPRGSGQGGATRTASINYRKLSDEQILEM